MQTAQYPVRNSSRTGSNNHHWPSLPWFWICITVGSSWPCHDESTVLRFHISSRGGSSSTDMVESDDLWLHYRNLLMPPSSIDGPHRACTGVQCIHSATAGNSIMTSMEGGLLSTIPSHCGEGAHHTLFSTGPFPETCPFCCSEFLVLYVRTTWDECRKRNPLWQQCRDWRNAIYL